MKKETLQKVAVIGAGSWGTALAKLLSERHERVWLWARRPEQVAAMATSRRNPDYLRDIDLPMNLEVTSSMKDALAGAQLVVVAVPTEANRATLADMMPFLESDALLLSATKGIEQGSLRLVAQIFEEVLPAKLYERSTYLGGPSFAREVCVQMPTAVSVACIREDIAKQVQELLTTEWFRVYTSTDVIGVEVGGALKNVIAIAAGIGDGLGLGHNSRAAIMTRGLAELTRLAVRMGADPLTLAGLSGMGDLVLTCTGDLSRNRRVGIEIGRGKTLEVIMSELGMVAEGVQTAYSTHALANSLGVEMPITEQVYRVLYEDKSAKDALHYLMTRPAKDERA